MSDVDFLEHVERVLAEVASAPLEDRSTLLNERCGDDARLRSEVEGLLRSRDQLGDFLQASPVDVLGGHDSYIGQEVGPYRLERLLGAGGMGAVYAALRVDGQYDKQVAIKFIAGRLINPRLRDTFLRERQMLASLQHPNIAQLLDGGVTDDGQPYLVMEYIDGLPVTDACDSRCMTINERIDMFDEVCAAVQYAHANLIVHRDLKPQNILVDEAGRPKLLDFGIAKMLDAGATARDVTVTAERRFTPQYAAPELVTNKAVTVATDVYALGLILYELLAGRKPYDVGDSSPAEQTRTICDTLPTPLAKSLEASAGLDSDDGTRSIADARNVSVTSLRKQLRGDLDAIVHTAIRKEPERRYASVGELRDDLRRHAAGLPVSAKPDTWSYRASRFVQRHRVPVAAGSLLAVILIAASIISTMLAIRLNDRSNELSEAVTDREEALDEVSAQRDAVEREFRRAKASGSMMITTIETAAMANEPIRQRIIDEVRKRRDQLDNLTMPLTTEAEIAARQSLAMMARTLDAYDLALEQNQRVIELTEGLANERYARTEAFTQIGWVNIKLERPKEAVKALQSALTIDGVDPNPHELKMIDLLLMEAHAMNSDTEAAKNVLRSKRMPAAPLDVFLRQEIQEIEQRLGVSLLEEFAD